MDRNKRLFLKLAFGAGVLSLQQFAWGKRSLDTIELLQCDLFPALPNGLDVHTINARAYLAHILRHPRVSLRQKHIIHQGIVQIEQLAKKRYRATYVELGAKKRQVLLAQIAKTPWGEGFIQEMLGFIFEALLGDPIYGINKDGVGWRWTRHTPGLPRPLRPVWE